MDHDVDVGERIAVHRDEVGEVAGRDRSKIARVAQQRGRNRRRGGERLRGRHPGPDEPAELACVLTEHAVDRVGAHPELHARLERTTRRVEVLLDVGTQRRNRVGAKPNSSLAST